ncbi:AKT-interacting protein homolog A [Caerostris extrusa]|uniref:AKT-interacting protein homolog A n=1 Tax=Caerostris extrusa TaxID=172846 RepID=A0AAV4NG19_CAEEX|nr:AKT-interacting protein homolog A [Caerostris extrusa]
MIENKALRIMASENFKTKGLENSDGKQQNISLKKVLPPTPNIGDLSSSAVAHLDRNTNSKQTQAYSAYFLEYSLISEYLLLQKQFLTGVYVIPSAGSPLKWFGVIFIRSGLYQGGVFRFTLYVPDNYPDCECPILVFDPPIFNPVINIETGELDVKRAFPKWRRNVNHLWQVVQYARRIFYKIETESPVNSEAAEMYVKDLELYKVRTSESLSACNEKLYEKPNTDDPHALHFTPWDQSVHEDFRKKIFSYKREKEQDSSKNSQTGLSWMQSGSLQIFSKNFS